MSGRHRCFRRPRTTQERRINGKRNVLDFDEYQVRTRPSRNFANLVEYRDETMRWGNRSWKEYRDHQWKPVDFGDFFGGRTLGQLMIEGLQEFLDDLKSGMDLETKYRIHKFE